MRLVELAQDIPDHAHTTSYMCTFQFCCIRKHWRKTQTLAGMCLTSMCDSIQLEDNMDRTMPVHAKTHATCTRTIGEVGVAGDPAAVSRAPVDIIRLDVKHVLKEAVGCRSADVNRGRQEGRQAGRGLKSCRRN